MDIAVAQQFLRENENAVLATWRLGASDCILQGVIVLSAADLS